MPETAAQALVRSLRAHDVDRVFCVPGESYLPVLEALRADGRIDVVSCRHESGAGFMAVADAKLTGRPGVCFVSRGPGATNAAIAVHTAEQDAAPMVLFVGQVTRRDRGRGAFQEVDYGLTFADMAKWIFEVNDPASLAEVIARAFHVAATATCGPTVVVLPEDMLGEVLAEPVIAPLPVPQLRADGHEVGVIAAALARAERPLLIAGGALSHQSGRLALLAAAESLQVPVLASFRRQDLFPNRHRLYAGHLGFKLPRRQVQLYAEADLVVAVGTRLGDVTTQGFALPRAPVPAQPLAHVYPDPAVIGRVFRTEYPLAADPAHFLAALTAGRAAAPPAGRGAWIERLHEQAVALARWQPRTADDGVVFGSVVQALIPRLDPAAVLILDSGNFSGWVHRYFPFDRDNLLLGAISGAMGLAVPAAVAAGLRLPGRQIVTFIGDGGYLMTGNELATAVQRRVPVRFFVCNNGSYATIRLHQETQFPGQVIATDLVNPDFAALGRAFGVHGLTIASEAEVEPVVEAALAHPGPVVVDVRSSLEHVSAFTTLTELRSRR